jgi:hypothetical protein
MLRKRSSAWPGIARVLAAAATILPAIAAGQVPAVIASGQYAIDTGTLGPSPRIPGATGVWVTFAPTMSIDCSPPRACYAATQRLYYVFGCSPRYAVLAERISMDLNGGVIKHEVADTYTTAVDAPAALVLNAYCAAGRREYQPWSR